MGSFVDDSTNVYLILESTRWTYEFIKSVHNQTSTHGSNQTQIFIPENTYFISINFRAYLFLRSLTARNLKIFYSNFLCNLFKVPCPIPNFTFLIKKACTYASVDLWYGVVMMMMCTTPYHACQLCEGCARLCIFISIFSKIIHANESLYETFCIMTGLYVS